MPEHMGLALHLVAVSAVTDVTAAVGRLVLFIVVCDWTLGAMAGLL